MSELLAADFGVEATLGAGAVPRFTPGALLFCCSKCVKAADVFALLFDGFGTTADDLWGAGMADLGVSGFVAVA